MGTHLRELIESYPMNTNMTGFRWLSKVVASLCLDISSLSIERVKGGSYLETPMQYVPDGGPGHNETSASTVHHHTGHLTQQQLQEI